MKTLSRPRPLSPVCQSLCVLALSLLHTASPAADHAPARQPHGAADAAAKTAAAAAAPDDPMEQLRQRLSERLAATKGSSTGGHEDLRVMSRGAPGAAAAPPGADKPGKTAARVGHGTSGQGGKGGDKRGAANDEHPAHWAYNGAGGPQTWGTLKPEFSLCSSGQRQSPIDIRGGLSVDLDPVRFDYRSSRFAVVDNGHTVQVNLAQGNFIDIGGRRFELQQFHFHRPSEERIDGRQFEMSVHLVHKDDEGRLAVVTVLLEKGPSQDVVQKVWNNLPLERNQELQARTPMELADLLPTDRRYYTYMGSLTTPPCSEGVQWVVMRQPVTVTPEQIEIFSRIYPMNARPLQEAAGRRIMQSN